MSERSVGETMSLTKENIAAMLAIIGKEEANTKSPTAIVMLSALKDNLKILFDKLHGREMDFCLVRMGNAIQQDDAYIEYGKIAKISGLTKTKACAQFMSTVQQYAGRKHLDLVLMEDGPEFFEFVVKVNDY
jgi:hypothetical protein